MKTNFALYDRDEDSLLFYIYPDCRINVIEASSNEEEVYLQIDNNFYCISRKDFMNFEKYCKRKYYKKYCKAGQIFYLNCYTLTNKQKNESKKLFFTL